MTKRMQLNTNFTVAHTMDRERSLTGLPANVCHRINVELSSAQLTVEKMKMDLSETRNSRDPDRTPKNSTKPLLNCIHNTTRKTRDILQLPLCKHCLLVFRGSKLHWRCFCHSSMNSVASCRYFMSLLSRSSTPQVRE